MWTILSPIWSKLWDAKVFLPADCVRRAFCLGHARVYVRSPRRESALRAKVFLAADCVRRAFCLGHARLCALPAQKARLSCQQPKILLAPVSSFRRTGAYLLGCVRRVLCLGHVRLWPPPRGRIHVCIILYIPCLILSGNEWRNGVPKIKRLWKSARYRASFSQPFYNKSILNL